MGPVLREEGVNPSRSRRCDRIRLPHEATGPDEVREGAADRETREPENLDRPAAQKEARVMPNLGIVLSALLVFLLSPPARGIPVYAANVDSFAPGPEDGRDPVSPPASFGSPDNALGPPDAGVVALGERGEITLALELPILDGPGFDLRVHENPFSFTDGTTGETFVFAELGFVEVSSDGLTFARFPTTSPLLAPIGEFGVIPFDQIPEFRGLAGLLPEGDPFDLADLVGIPVVDAGIVDLDAIRFVRIRDVVGDGSEFDGLGNPIFDPWPSASESSGFDLDAVVGLHPIPEPSTLALLAASIGLLALSRGRT
jgi:hypothetical protein